MISKKIFSLLGFLFIRNPIIKVFAAEADGCNVTSGKNCISNSYYVVEPSNYKVLTDADATGDLFYCSGDPVACKGITDIGYYVIDKDSVYTCQDNGEGLSCQRGKIPEANTACDGVGKIGQLIKNGEVISLCLNYETEGTVVDLTVGSSGNYLIHKNADPSLNVFGMTGNNQKFAIITIKDKVVKLHTTYRNGLKYVYGEKKTYRVMERDSKTCPVDPTTGLKEDEILELSCTNGLCKSSSIDLKLSVATASAANILKKNASGILVTPAVEDADFIAGFNAEKGNLQMYYCDAEKNCERITGYAKKDSKWFSMRIDSDVEQVSETPEAQDCVGKIGKVYKDSSDNNAYHLCLSDTISVKVDGVTDANFITGSGISSDLFQNTSNKLIKVTDEFIYVNPTFSAENSKLYFNKVATDFYAYKYLENSHAFVSDNTSGIFVYQTIDGVAGLYTEVNLAYPSLNGAVTTWIMFDCFEDDCKQAYGYVKSKEASPKYYYLPYDGVASNKQVGSTPAFSDCDTADDNGLLMSDGSLCVVGHGTTPIKYTMADGEVFVVDVKTGSPFASSGVKYIKSTGNTFSFSAVIAKEDIGIHLFTSGKEISSSKIDDDNKTALTLFDCSDAGVCTAVAGYAINGDKYYSISTTPASAEVTPSNVNVCTADSGKLINDGQGVYLCTGTTNKLNLAQPGFYALDNNDFASGSSFAVGDKLKMIQITYTLIGVNNVISDATGEYLFKIDDTYKHYTLSSSTYTAGTKTVIGVFERCKDKEENFINVYKEISLDTTTGITEDSDVANWALFDCDSGSCTPTYGYIKSGDDKYFSLAVNGTNSIVTDAILTSNTCAAATDAGILFNDSGNKKLCVDGTAATVVKVPMGASSLASLSNAKPNVFAPSEEGKTVIVKVEESSFTLSHSTDPYNVYKLDNGVITVADFSSADIRAKLGIFKCDDDVCENVPGYAFSTTYYAFSNTLGGTEVPNTITTCNGNIGNVATINAKKYLCLTGNDKVDVTTPAAGPNYYVVGTVAADSKLMANKIAKITDTYIVTDERWDGNNYLVKKDEVFTPYNYDKSTNKFVVASSFSGMKTYRQVGGSGSNLYEELSLSQITLADAPSLLLFSCDSGICEIRQGKILIGGTTVMTCGDTNCNTPDDVLAATADCDATDDVSMVFVDNKALKMCLTKGTTPDYEVAALDSTKVYYAGTSTSTYKRLIVNSSKTVIMEQTEIGYFFVRNNALVSSYAAGDSVIQCTGLDENCSVINTFTATCTSAEVGTFTSTKELCLNESGKKTGALGTEGSYLIAYGASSGFTPLVKSGQFGVIKMTATSIVPDTEKSYICVDANLVVTERASASATCTSSTAYACNSIGVCQEGSIIPELPDFPDCPSASGDGPAVTYCIKSDNTVHGVNAANAYISDAISTGVHIIDESTKFDVSLADTSAITQNSDIITWRIYDCDDTGICQRTYGYVKSLDGDPRYFAVGAGTTGNKIVTPAACSAVGGLLTDGKICLTANDSTGATFETSEYLLSNLAATNIFTGTAVATGLIIKGTASTFTLKLDVSGYHLAKGQEITTSSPDTLVHCISDISCTPTDEGDATEGYYKNKKGELIKCTGTECQSDALDGSECSASIIGKIDSTGVLCLAADKTGEFTDGKKYLIDYTTSTRNFPKTIAIADNKFVLVEATKYSIILSAKTENICANADLVYVQDKSGECAVGDTGYTHCAEGEYNSSTCPA